ncbi:hypothetical protein C361_05378 [Cryptococcus neoformans Tu259-1]|uniref:DNA endonuclease activator Ctp1 C-terminal domain-containing protein n=1 Tax=Cryptococcus neoformans Tu259-1 TaxID=1230072 RepID=A0A854Q6U2_CRYNE|nr:hypothetical protein C361_05378 [Cryptococcus neoformans var. grubii Tu259-1]
MDTPKRNRLLTRTQKDTERASRWWNEGIKASASASCDLPSVLNSPSKRNHAMEEEIKRLNEEVIAAKNGYERQLEGEAKISMSLRDRIGKLEEKFRKEKAKVELAQIKENEMKISLELLEDQLKREREDWSKDINDLKATLAKERDEKRRVQEEINRLKEGTSRSTEASAPPLSDVFMSSRALQPINANIPTSLASTAPSTPSRKIAAHPPSPSALRKAYAHLESQHKALKAAYDKLQERHERDIKYLKIYAAVVADREERRREKRAEKRVQRSTRKNNTPSESFNHEGNPPAIVHQDRDGVGPTMSGTTASNETDTSGAIEVTDTEMDTDNVALNNATKNDQPTSFGAPKMLNMTLRQVLVPTTPGTPALAQPKNQNRASSWLATPQPPAPSTSLTHEGNHPDPDLFSPPDKASAVTTPSAFSRNLVRDRLGESSLRKTVVSRALGTEVPNPLTLRSETSSASTPGPSSIRGDSSGAKRKAIDLEGLSPAEKAAQRRLINKLPASEKRELYKEYKKGGRYMVLEALEQRATEEFEIDPAQNKGAAFAFHDVKRKKTERMQMHGGECECCKGYYEAVGVMPKFYQAPTWKDQGQVEEEDGEQKMREHLNKVSRHREDWVKPPTPPGYWQIGFPTTQEVEEQNRKADEMARERDEKIRKEAMQKDGKWRKKSKV